MPVKRQQADSDRLDAHRVLIVLRGWAKMHVNLSIATESVSCRFVLSKAPSALCHVMPLAFLSLICVA
jgi:hypothetical protein